MLPKTPAMPAKPRPTGDKMEMYRRRLRAQGLRPVQIWVPDIRAPGFRAAICHQIQKLDAEREAETLDFIAAAADPALR